LVTLSREAQIDLIELGGAAQPTDQSRG